MENNFEDLIVVGDKKRGIFNKRTCQYILNKDYDCVLLSQCGNHIVKNYTYFDEIDEKTGETYQRRETVFNAIVNNDGKIVEYKDLVFCDKFIGDVAVAYSKKSNRRHLVNCKGEISSDGFDRIEYINCGLYYAFNLRDNENYNPNIAELSDRWFVEDLRLINKKGEVLPFTLVLDGIENPIYSKIKEINSFKSFVNAIKKYGCGIAHVGFTYVEPKSISELLQVINAGINYVKQNSKDISEVLSLVGVFSRSLMMKEIELDVKFNDIEFDLEMLCLGIEMNYYKKHIMGTLIEPIYKFNKLLHNK